MGVVVAAVAAVAADAADAADVGVVMAMGGGLCSFVKM